MRRLAFFMATAAFVVWTDPCLRANDGGITIAPPSPVVGSPAPAFALNALEGGRVSLDSLHGRIVVLEFWAGWCKFSAPALPPASKAALAFRDRGVAFYAVNMGESAADAKKFLTAHHLHIPVLLDSDSNVGGNFQVGIIPTVIVIGRSGKIEAAHVGDKPQVPDQIRQELTSLLAGKNLASPTTKP